MTEQPPYLRPPIVTKAAERPILPGVNGFATTSLVLGIFSFAPLVLGPVGLIPVVLAIVFGILALVQLRSRIQDGKGRAIGGLCAVGVWLMILTCLVTVALYDRIASDNAAQIVDPSTISLTRELVPGICVIGLADAVTTKPVATVPCAQPHDGEVFAVFDLPDGAFPGKSAVSHDAQAGCTIRIIDYAPGFVDDRRLYLRAFPPNSIEWPEDRAVVCVVASTEPTTGSIRTEPIVVTS